MTKDEFKALRTGHMVQFDGRRYKVQSTVYTYKPRYERAVVLIRVTEPWKIRESDWASIANLEVT